MNHLKNGFYCVTPDFYIRGGKDTRFWQPQDCAWLVYFPISPVKGQRAPDEAAAHEEPGVGAVWGAEETLAKVVLKPDVASPFSISSARPPHLIHLNRNRRRRRPQNS